MKILHIVANLRDKNGIGTVVHRLYEEQVKLTCDVKIISVSENRAYTFLPTTQVQKKDEFQKFLSKWKPDVVLFHSLWCFSFIVFSKHLIQEHIPYAVMMHGANSKENRKKSILKKTIANFLWFNSFLKNAKRIIYLNLSEYNNCVSKEINSFYDFIPNGCDSNIQNLNFSKKNDCLQFVYLGRMSLHHKGLDILLDALDILNVRNFHSCYFLFYGEGDTNDMKEINRRLKNLDGIAKFMGPAYGDTKDRVLRNADAFILTSRYEGMPMGVLEALSYGVPCLLTPGTNMAEDVGKANAGWSTDFNATSIANCITDACSNLSTSYCNLHKAAFNLSLKYNWQDITKAHIRLLENMLFRN